MTKKCIQCGKEFELNKEDIQFYMDKNWTLPKHCPECTEKQHKKMYMSDEARQAIKQKKRKQMLVGGIGSLIVALVLAAFLIWWHDEENSIRKKSYRTSDIMEEVRQNDYRFRTDKLMKEHFDKHGADFSYSSVEEYLAGANSVMDAAKSLHKTEQKDGDYVFYLRTSNELVILSKDGYIRTYFKPDGGMNYYSNL